MDTPQNPSLHRLSAITLRTGLSRSALYREINAKKLHVVKIGRSVRISEAELARYIHAVENGEG